MKVGREVLSILFHGLACVACIFEDSFLVGIEQVLHPSTFLVIKPDRDQASTTPRTLCEGPSHDLLLDTVTGGTELYLSLEGKQLGYACSL